MDLKIPNGEQGASPSGTGRWVGWEESTSLGLRRATAEDETEIQGHGCCYALRRFLILCGWTGMPYARVLSYKHAEENSNKVQNHAQIELNTRQHAWHKEGFGEMVHFHYNVRYYRHFVRFH